MTVAPRIAVYTCITANYDPLSAPTNVDPRLSYYCFSDVDSPSVPPWTHRLLDLPALSPKDRNRHVKMHPHLWLPEYDATVYLDGNIDIVGDLHSLVCSALAMPEDLFLFDHFERHCVFTEAAHCSHFSHDWVWTIASQMRRYNAEGYPRDNGLFDASVIIRRNAPAVQRLMTEWWREYRAGAKRDQLSLPVVARRLGIPLRSLGENDMRFSHHYVRFGAVHPSSSRMNVTRTARKYVNRAVASTFSYRRLFGLSEPLRWR